LLFLSCLEKILLRQGHRVPAGAGVAAATQMYDHFSQPAVAGVRK